tara:strand:+ start:955 stop:1122 length:168 start_codon:yes stop_codon:yes gene_type:complete
MNKIKTKSHPLALNRTEMKIIERGWGIERCYISPDGEQICTPAPFSTNNRNINWF